MEVGLSGGTPPQNQKFSHQIETPGCAPVTVSVSLFVIVKAERALKPNYFGLQVDDNTLYFGKGGVARRVYGSEFVCGGLTDESVLCVG
jgi:hypothetical protein